jgi:uncharacterized protein YbjT (DUF2867 family)
MTVLVTGATGTVGRQVVRHLREAGHPVRVLTRDPAKVDRDDVEVVAGDLADTATLAEAFDGVEAAHLITFGKGGYLPLDNGQQIVDLAERAGVRAVSVLNGWQEGTLEPAVRASGLAWTFLAPVEFMANTSHDWGPTLRATGVVREPYGDRPSPAVHESDIGAVAATVLTTDGHAGQVYRLTGPALVTPKEKIRLLAQATGRDLRFEELTHEQARAEWTTAPPDLLFFQIGGASPKMVDLLLSVYRDAPEIGRTVTDAVPTVTGRPARSFADWATDHADEFTGPG